MYQIKLSPYAKTFYIEWLLSPTSDIYNIVMDQILYGDLDIKRLKSTLIRYITEHVILNSHIQDIDGEPYWVKNDRISELEYSGNPISNSELIDYIAHDFDLFSGPLYRFRLLKISDGVYRFFIILHHLLIDASSEKTGVFEAISNYYNDENYVAKHSIDDQIKRITNLTDTLSAKLEQNRAKYKEFWRKQLTDIESIALKFLKLDTGDDRNNNEKTLIEKYNSRGEIKFSYGETELAKLNQIKHKYVVTPYIYGQCIFALLLYRYTSQNRFAISYPIAIKEGIDFIYGAQINTSLIPYQFNQQTTILDLLNQSKNFFKSLKQYDSNYSYYPITNIIQEGNNSLLDVCFVQTKLRNAVLKFEGITKIEASTEFGETVSKEMLLFEQELKSDRLNYRVRYDKSSINEELLNNFVASYKKLFIEVLEDLIAGDNDKPTYSYNLLDQKQYRQIVYEFNQTDKNYPKTKTIQKLFEEQVLKTPNKIAVVYQKTRLTYQELNNKANQLANYLLHNYKVKPDDLITLCLDKNEHMLISILATLKSGGAYIPLEPSCPNDRINYVINNAKTKVVLTNIVHKNKLQLAAKQKIETLDVIAVDSKEMQAKLILQDNTNPNTSTISNNLIYVIYTSGTTGNPKGVLLEHRSIINFVIYLIDTLKLNHKSIGSNYSAFGFDALVTEIYPILLSGGTLCIVTDEDRMDPVKVNNFFNQNHVTYAFLPTKFAEFFFQLENTYLVNLIVAGDKLSTFIKQKYRIINAYGPTEASVHTTSFVIDRLYNNIPIGKPINNVKCYVIDANLNILPLGAVGELAIGGECLARGYLNDYDLTTRKFISNPFQTKEEKIQNKNARIYKTGDLARMLPDGNLEFIGRNDFQVKIRGYRIELGEIEIKLANYPGITQAVVLANEYHDAIGKNTNEKYLVAYYVADNQLDETKIQDYLATQLPKYMLPNAYIYLEKLPLTVNGKLDRKALPEPKFESKDQYVPPSNEQERLICEIFAKVLGLKKVGVNDDFFKLGGNSLKAISLTSILQSHFDIKVADIFNLRTPQKLAENSYFGKDALKQRLEQVKLLSQYKQSKKHVIDAQLQKKIDCYLESINNLKVDYSLRKPIVNVLLTGATGYLGCNILNQLLKLTNYKVFLLIRADTQEEAIKRINSKFQFYFDKALDDNAYSSRVFVIKADIEKNNLGLSQSEYQALITKTDSIIHAAALVKHYGEYDQFYSANVQATINLLELAKLTKLKDFHYISTYSVLNCGFIPNCEEYAYTEDDLPDNLQQWDNVYIKTKLLGERATIEYRSYGVNGNIYRVGNLAFMAENYRAQENIGDNAFFNWLKCLFKMQCIAQDFNLVEISQSDLTAQAIVKLFDKKELENSIYHVFNPYLFNISSIFTDQKSFSFMTLTMEQFVDNITNNLSNNIYHDLIVKFLLHQGWLDGWSRENTTSISVLQNRTQYILEQLDFKWLPVTKGEFNGYIDILS